LRKVTPYICMGEKVSFPRYLVPSKDFLDVTASEGHVASLSSQWTPLAKQAWDQRLLQNFVHQVPPQEGTGPAMWKASGWVQVVPHLFFQNPEDPRTENIFRTRLTAGLITFPCLIWKQICPEVMGLCLQSLFHWGEDSRISLKNISAFHFRTLLQASLG
jgi:hypothetical protein